MFRYLIRLLLMFATPILSGCMGGSLAQQVASSIATSMADDIISNSIEAQEKEDRKNKLTLRSILTNPSPNPERTAMLTNFEFSRVEAITEPLPDYTDTEEDIPLVILKTNALVVVELHNLLIGDEKLAVLQRARLKGALNLPEVSEWSDWYVATGAIQQPEQSHLEIITFLIPPEIGKLPSGSHTTVELSNTGDVNIARY